MTHILVVDDQKDILFLTKVILEAEGYVVDGVASGKEALSQAKKTSYTLILLDLMMPKMTGYEVLDSLRMNEVYKKAPVIAFTAKAFSGDREQSLAFGFNDYIDKPFKPEDLVALVKKYLKKAPRQFSTPN